MCLPSPLAQIWSRFRKCCWHQPCERQSPEKTTDRRHHRNAVTKFMCHTGMTPEPNVLIVHEYAATITKGKTGNKPYTITIQLPNNLPLIMPTTTVKPTRFLILYPYVPLNDTHGIAYPETCLPIKLQNRRQQRSTARYWT